MMYGIPDGRYPATAGGHVSEFKVDGYVITATFENGVRGFGIPDAVTVDSSTQTIRSFLLGNAVTIKQVKEVTHQLKKPILPDIKIPLIDRNDSNELRINQNTNTVSLWAVENACHIRDLDQFEANFVLSTIKAMKESK